MVKMELATIYNEVHMQYPSQKVELNCEIYNRKSRKGIVNCAAIRELR